MPATLEVADLHGDALPVWTIDFESYYDDDYSLSKMPTAQYVRDPRFLAHGAGVVEPDGSAYWVHGEDLAGFFASRDWSRTAFLGHNTAFDAFIANFIYNAPFGFYLDTMSMSLGHWGPGLRASLEETSKRCGRQGKIKGALAPTKGLRELPSDIYNALAVYGIADAVETYEVYRHFINALKYPAGELPVIHLTIKAAVEPMLVIDAGLLRQEIEEEQLKVDALLSGALMNSMNLGGDCAKVLAAKGVKGLLASNPCFAELLRGRGIVPPTKPSPKNPEGPQIYAFAKNDLAFQAMEDDPRVSDLIQARLGVKSTQRRTRAQRFLDVTHDGRYPLPVPLGYCRARTHRWTGQDKLNLQNLDAGRRGGVGRLRRSVQAPKGMRFVSADASQIECRINATLWGQTDLIQLFRDRGDPYSDLASKIYGVPVGKKGPNAHLRPLGKAMELGLGYGMWVTRFLDSCLSGAITGEKVIIDDMTARNAVLTYREFRNKIVEGWRRLDEMLAIMATERSNRSLGTIGPIEFFADHIVMPNGLPLWYRGLHPISETTKDGRRVNGYKYFLDREEVYLWGSKLDENIIQSLSRTVVAEQAVVIGRELPVVLLVHDEVDALAPEAEADATLEFMLGVMRTPPTWMPEAPLDSEGYHDYCYSK
jgi:hypothetical protein